MEVTNISNYPKVVNGVRIEPGATETVDFRGKKITDYRDDGDLKFEDDSAPSNGESEDVQEETSKPEEKTEQGE